VLQDLAHEMAGHALVLKVDTDANPELAARYRVQSIPNFVVFRNGKPTLQRVGMAPRAEMRRWLEPSVARAGSGMDP
jgi:thioredoxin 2